MRRSRALLRRCACGAALALLLLAPVTARAQEAKDDTILLTIFLRHDQSKPLDQINAQLRAQGYYKKFPPPGIEVASWYVMMGIGQVVTLKVPASRLREVNRAIEQSAWAATALSSIRRMTIRRSPRKSGGRTTKKCRAQ